MHLFLITDIFGINQAIIDLQQCLESIFDKVSIVDPYQGQAQKFASETEAYSGFVNVSGHELYFQKAKTVINQSDDKKCLLGFSAGASVCWRLSELLTPNSTLQIIAFYPSQIRNYLNLQPKVNTTIVFPNTEALFSVEESIEMMESKNFVSTHHSKYPHGFMNSSSTGYSDKAQKSYSSLISQLSFFIDPIATINNYSGTK
jgi:dienelactone hydrolase